MVEQKAIGVVGWGVVGGGVVDILRDDGALFAERCGFQPVVKAIVTDPATTRRRPEEAGGALVSARIEAITQDPAITTAVHAVGGTTVAKELLVALLRSGKHVVTSNKALIALHGDELFALAAQHGVGLAFEAAVAGGIPIIGALRDGLVANRIESLHAILNGTCNFILTKMEQDGIGYRAALTDAQQLGYAEADPTLDVDGTDTAHKLSILSRIAFAARIPVSSIRTEGIQRISARDIASAKAMGCRIKLLAVARRRSAGLELRVAPTLVPLDHPLAAVMQNYNGIAIRGNNAGPQLFVGQGAGALPTASAVIADLVDVLSGRYQSTADHYQFFKAQQTPAFIPETEEMTGSYARFVVADKSGVLAGITHILSRHGASILSIHQGAANDQQQATVEIVTHPLSGGAFLAAIAEIDQSGLTVQPTTCLRKMDNAG